MRKLALTLVPLLVLACGQEPVAPEAVPAPAFAATSDWTDVVVDLPAGDFKFYAPCVDDYFDEVGPILLSFHTVTTDNGTLFYSKLRVLEGFHIVGDRTGLWNQAVPNQGGTSVQHIPAGTGSYTFHYNLDPYLYVSEASGTKMNWPYQVKVTVTPNGQVAVNRTADWCKIIGK